MIEKRTSSEEDTSHEYRVEAQIGHLLRRAHQRASSIFQSHFGDVQLTPTQFAALAKLKDEKELSQNHLGRLTAMDPATIQGVTRRLIDRGLVQTRADDNDKRRMLLRLTEEGERLTDSLFDTAALVTRKTLASLNDEEQRKILELLSKLA
ncbi:MarR family winged helix-turn-helix transcriptional regulator [Sneathiella aquimaris]|uniref:MarR family winged helix-turn-helix transcriptional regulator n=1 Tax=Sneathiella aquimaris TaxID=2599305 RepID=UPI00146D02BF|nr:MarR family transcriptional regulator [Sneathiella aquimaris]